MASSLEYALSLETEEFENALKDAEASLGRLDTTTAKSRTSLEGLAAAAGDVGAGLKSAASDMQDLGNASDGVGEKLDQVINIQRAQVALEIAKSIEGIGDKIRETAKKFEGTDSAFSKTLTEVATGFDAASAAATGAAAGFALAGPAGAAFGAVISGGLSLAKSAFDEMTTSIANADAAAARLIETRKRSAEIRNEVAQEDQAAAAAATAAQNEYEQKKNRDAATAADFREKEVARVEEANEKARVRREQRESAALEKSYAAKLSKEDNLERQIQQLKARGNTDPAALPNNPFFEELRVKAVENAAELLALETELAELQKQKADAAQREAAAAEQKAKAAQKEREAADKKLTAQEQAASLYALENKILEARAGRQDKLVKSLERQAEVEQLKLELMRQQGLSETAAAAAAEKRIALEERAARPRRGLLDVAASAAARVQRRSAADAARSGDGLGNTDRLAIANLERRANRPLSPARAAQQIEGGRPAADPGQTRREEREERKMTPDQNLLKTVKDIAEKFENLAKA